MPLEVVVELSGADVYRPAVVTIPGLALSDPSVDVRGSRVAWGLTILHSAPNHENAVRFLQLLFKPGDVGQTTPQQVGPSPISPPIVSPDEFAQLPAELQALTASGDPLNI